MVAPIMPSLLRPADLAAFQPSADLWTRLQRNYARLEETKYYPANVYQRAKEHERWPGDTEGRTLLAWILLARATGRPPRYLADMLALWPTEVNSSGYFGKLYTDGVSEQQISSHGWVLQALAELHHAAQAGLSWASAHDARALALPIIENLFLPTANLYAAYTIDPAIRQASGDYSGTHYKQIGPWILSTDVGCFTIGMTGLIDAAEAFDLVPRLTPLIEEMIARFLAIDLKSIKAQTHATLTALRGLIRWSRLTSNPALWAEIQSRYQLYTDFAWTETYANFNWFNRPQWTEPCAMVDSLIVAIELWQHTRDTRYLAQSQFIWFNALGHGFRANGGFGCDTCPGANGETELKFSVPESHWCCTMRGSEGLARMCEYQVFPDTDALLLPFGLPGDYHHGDTRLRIASTYPHAAEWTFTNTGPHALTVRLFIPNWIAGVPSENQWHTMRLAPGTSQTLTGTLIASDRDVLHATTAQNPGFGPGKVRLKGPLVLARVNDAWNPIFADYLRGDMTKEHSAKELIIRPPACQAEPQPLHAPHSPRTVD